MPAGGMAVMSPALLTVKLAAAADPNLTAEAPAKLEPVIDTELPPVDGPEMGVTAATVGGVVIVPKVNLSFGPVALVATGVVTVMSTVVWSVPEDGKMLEIVDALTSEPTLRAYHLLPSVRGDLLAKLHRLDEARAEFERAATLTRNGREREMLLDRAAACARGSELPEPR